MKDKRQIAIEYADKLNLSHSERLLVIESYLAGIENNLAKDEYNRGFSEGFLSGYAKGKRYIEGQIKSWVEDASDKYELEEEIEEGESGWISVDSKLPPVTERVMCKRGHITWIGWVDVNMGKFCWYTNEKQIVIPVPEYWSTITKEGGE
jgi:hypothetical protein